MRVPVRVVLLALAVLLAACGGSRIGGDVAASVNGETIPTSSVSMLVEAQTSSGEDPAAQPGPDSFQNVDQLQRQVLAQLIADRVVAHAAEDEGITVTEEETEQRWQELASQFGGEEGLRQEIENRGRTEEDVRQQLEAGIRAEKLQARFAERQDVPEERLREVYAEREEAEYRVAKASHILVESEETAQEVLDRLEAGESFEDLAREISIDAYSSENGGALGEQPRGTYVEAFEEALWNSEKGDILGPIETQFGYHIIRNEGIRTVPFDEVRDQLEQELVGADVQTALEDWLTTKYREADIDIDPRFGTWDPETGQIVAPEGIGGETQPGNEAPADTGSPAASESPAS